MCDVTHAAAGGVGEQVFGEGWARGQLCAVARTGRVTGGRVEVIQQSRYSLVAMPPVAMMPHFSVCGAMAVLSVVDGRCVCSGDAGKPECQLLCSS